MNIMIKEKDVRQAEVMCALGHPMRLAIVRGLLKDECNVNKIVKRFDIPQSTISQHLRVLKSAQIIKGKRKGVCVCYRVIDKFVRKMLKNKR